MSLLILPPELLLQVMERLGVSFFRDDLRRLTLCKHWYHFACKVFWAEVKLSAKQLKWFLISPNVTGQSEMFRSSLKSLALEFAGFDEWEAIIPEDGLATTEAVAADVALDDCRQRLLEWTARLDDAIFKASDFIEGCSSLRTLQVKAFTEGHSLLPNLPRRDYLYAPTLSHVLSLESITVLELDTCGTSYLSGEEHHICQYIGCILPRLHGLRLRMRSICPLALHPPKDSNPLSLKEVVVNLSLANESPLITSASFSNRCGSPAGGSFLELKSDIEEQARLLLCRLECPRTVRILYHSLPSLDMQSLDVITGKRMALAATAAWDDDGETEYEDSGQPDFSDDVSSISDM